MDEIKIEQLEQEPEEEKKKTSAKPFIIAASIIIIIFIGIFSLKFIINPTAEVITIDQLHLMNINGELDPSQGYIYNGFSFVKSENMWFTRVSSEFAEFEIPLHFSPNELEDVKVSGSQECGTR